MKEFGTLGCCWWSWEDKDADRNLDDGGQAHKISEQSKRSSLLAARLEVCATFQHKVCLCSACALKFKSDGH